MEKLTLENLEKAAKEVMEECGKGMNKDLHEAGFLYVSDKMWEEVRQAILDEVRNKNQKGYDFLFKPRKHGDGKGILEQIKKDE